MNGQYILEGKIPKKIDDLHEWAKSFESQNRTVAKTNIGEILISTVFLGLDHQYGEGDPLLFETMVFGIDDDEYQERYSTWEQAEEGHNKAIEFVKSKIDFNN